MLFCVAERRSVTQHGRKEKTSDNSLIITRLPRAENETRTRDPNLGKVVLYQLSYFRSCMASSAGGQAPFGSANISAYSDSSKLFRQKISLSPPFSDAALRRRIGQSRSPSLNSPPSSATRNPVPRTSATVPQIPTRCRRNQAISLSATMSQSNHRCSSALLCPTSQSRSPVTLPHPVSVPQLPA